MLFFLLFLRYNIYMGKNIPSFILSVMILGVLFSPLQVFGETSGDISDPNFDSNLPDFPTLNQKIPDSVISDLGVRDSTVSDSGKKLENPVNFDSLRELITAILDVIVQIGVPIAAVFLIYSGYLFVSARGDVGKIEDAKSIFLWTLVGIAVLLGASVLANLIDSTIDQLKR